MRRFLQFVDGEHFWDEPSPTPELILDGGYCAIEGVKSGKYQLLADFSFRGKIARIGNLMEALSK